MKLVNIITKQEIKNGDTVTDFRGTKMLLESFDARRVYCRVLCPDGKPELGYSAEYFPSVIGCEVQE